MKSPKPLTIAEILLLIIIVIGGGWLLMKKPPGIAEPNPIPTLNIDTANWEVYRNKKYGFEFWYPKNDSPWQNHATEDMSPPYRADIHVSVEDGHNQLFEVTVNALGHGTCGEGNDDIVVDTKLVTGIQAKHFICRSGSRDTVEVLSFSHGTNDFEIVFGYDDDSQKQVTYQILSTFRFIEPTASNNPATWETYRNDDFSTNLNGYFETCMDTSAMYKRINGSWEKVSTELPGKGLYYLDNKFVGYGMCDVVVCTELPKPYTTQLVEYKKVGEKAPPSNSGSTANTLPVYQTVSLSGDVKIDIQYFSDKNCQNKKTFSTVIKR